METIAVLPHSYGQTHHTAAASSAGAAPGAAPRNCRRAAAAASVPVHADVPRPRRLRLLLPRQHPLPAGHLAPPLHQAQAGAPPPMLGTLLQHLGYVCYSIAF